MIVANKSVTRTRQQIDERADEDITATGLLGLSLLLIVRWVESQLLRAHLRSLQRLADYFTWQQENGTAGLADTHKRIAMAKAELHQLQNYLRR